MQSGSPGKKIGGVPGSSTTSFAGRSARRIEFFTEIGDGDCAAAIERPRDPIPEAMAVTLRSLPSVTATAIAFVPSTRTTVSDTTTGPTIPSAGGVPSGPVDVAETRDRRRTVGAP